MKSRQRRATRRANEISIDQVIAASRQLTQMDESLKAQGYTCASGRLYPCRDGSYTARVVWRNRSAGMTFAGSVQGLVLRP
ncbi:hypothetical protein EJV44_04580 [Ancylobacter aquaticus]|nr:hypothetical protein EJV44_04580 [Ancylobacter aquaticus]